MDERALTGIVIDPGHGGVDGGASGNGIVEKDLTLDISKYMFDRFFRIQQHESHGDIIVWPMRLLGTYLESTKDYGILNEMLEDGMITHKEYSEARRLIVLLKYFEKIRSTSHLPFSYN